MIVKNVKIPETRFELPSLLPSDVELFGVEVGTDMGTYASQLLASYLMLHLTTVDPWLPYKDGFSDMPWDRGSAVKVFRQNMEPFRNRHIHLKMSSIDAAAYINRDLLKNDRNFSGDTGFNFVYIDGAHDLSSVKKDLEAWWPLVRPGGMLTGHDFNLPDVSTPVIAFAKRHRLNLMLVNEHGGPDMAVEEYEMDIHSAKYKMPKTMRLGSGQDRNGGWTSVSWFMMKPE